MQDEFIALPNNLDQQYEHNFLFTDIYKALEKPLGKELLDMYFDHTINNFTRKEIYLKYNLNFNTFNDKFKIVEKYIKNFLIQNGY